MTEHNGIDRLADPATNKSTAFTPEEREAFGLRGLLPYAVSEIIIERMYDLRY